MKTLIENFLTERVANTNLPFYRQPLTGYARADDEIFIQFKSVVGDSHLLPTDLLPGAKSVLAFFLPYTKEIISGNREGISASLQWAEAYDCTNKLIDNIFRELNEVLAGHGVKVAWLLPTYEFDKKRLVAQWSHKHVAYACGLGNFGQNHLLITSKGCAGRFGTAVLDVNLEPSLRSGIIQACWAEKGCEYCRKNCPVQALHPSGFDRHKCYSRCLANDTLFPHLDCVEVCGKCSTGPCAYLE